MINDTCLIFARHLLNYSDVLFYVFVHTYILVYYNVWRSVRDAEPPSTWLLCRMKPGSSHWCSLSKSFEGNCWRDILFSFHTLWRCCCCSHSCPGVDWQRRGIQCAPSAPLTHTPLGFLVFPKVSHPIRGPTSRSFWDLTGWGSTRQCHNTIPPHTSLGLKLLIDLLATSRLLK